MKIGILRIDRMGDMILTLPIIKSIKISNSKAEIHIFSSNKNTKILKNFKYIDKIFNVNKNEFSKQKYDFLLNFSPGWKSFIKCLFLTSSIKANIIFTSRYKSGGYSKLLIIFLSKIFFNKTLVIHRRKRFKELITIHQTLAMFELLEICKIACDKNILIEKFFYKTKSLKSNKKICLIHLSSKWINDYYDENDFIKLIEMLEPKFNIILTSDETTKNKFLYIFNKFDNIQNDQFKNFNIIERTTILEKMNFDNWIQLIISSNLIISPECGCTHIAALCNVSSKIIYDADNQPEMISSEYAPWKTKYEKYVFSDKNLNKLLTNDL